MIVIKIETSGSAFGSDDRDYFTIANESARILREIADRLENGYGLPRTVRDINGNACAVCTGWPVDDTE